MHSLRGASPFLSSALSSSKMISRSQTSSPASSSASSSASLSVSKMNSIDTFLTFADSSLVKQLHADPDYQKFAPNKKSREVKSGHYVPVLPTPLPDPFLIAYSEEMLGEFRIAPQDAMSDSRFVKFFAGNMDAFLSSEIKTEAADATQSASSSSVSSSSVPPSVFQSWATPYALAIYGQDYTSNCPFRTGNGYGDGRAVSVGEVDVPHGGRRWEMQLKGGGTTPFCRGADGRAVLRSSIREFLGSEAMHHLGVSTTRALCLVGSRTETVDRPWFSGEQHGRSRDPDVMVSNIAAITTRVSPSFLRVGQIQLFERRARMLPLRRQKKEAGGGNGDGDDDVVDRKQELAMVVDHLLFREYPRIHALPAKSLSAKVLMMMAECAERFAALMAHWVRVGFCQGNFNSDNCLAGGRTMDYGPFGFIEKFDPQWCMWTGGSPHFSFMNQPNAGFRNFISLAKAVQPLLSDGETDALQKTLEAYMDINARTMETMWQQKLGLVLVDELDPSSSSLSSSSSSLSSSSSSSSASASATPFEVEPLLNLLKKCQCDYTIFFRQLSRVVARYFFVGTDAESRKIKGATTAADCIQILTPCFHAPLSEEGTKAVTAWLLGYFGALEAVHGTAASINSSSSSSSSAAAAAAVDAVVHSMNRVNPKFVPREWMLIDAYTRSDSGDDSEVRALHELFKRPYDEQSEAATKKYYQKAPKESPAAGREFMT